VCHDLNDISTQICIVAYRKLFNHIFLTKLHVKCDWIIFFAAMQVYVDIP